MWGRRRRHERGSRELSDDVESGDGSAGGASGDRGSGDGGNDSDNAAQGGSAAGDGAPSSVETVTETFVDDGRPTEDPEDERDAPTRTLETDLYVPDGPGPFPLIVHAHGFTGHPRNSTELATTWAEAGYVVAVPAFPLTNDRSGAPPSVAADYTNQPADMTFVVDEVLRLSGGDHPVLGGRVDGDRIGVSGSSLGGATVYGLAFNDCCRDDRVDAVAVMDGFQLRFGPDRFAFEGAPLLLFHATEDPDVPYNRAVNVYDQAASPKFFVTLEADTHVEPYDDRPSPHDEMVETTTLAFWDAHLRDDPEATTSLVDAAESADATRITAEP